MLMDTENPMEFLDAAKAAVQKYAETKVRLEEQREAERQAGAILERSQKEVSDRIQKTLRQRSEEINDTYDRQLSQLDSRLKKIQSDRDRAKQEGIKGRIRGETEPLRLENRELKRQLKAVLKKDSAPGFCSTGVFFTLFRPSGFGELLIFLLVFILVFALLPFGVYQLLPKHRLWQLVLLYGADVLIFGGLYLLINNATVGKHGAAVRQGREIRNRIRLNKKKIRTIIRGVRSDSGEEGYNLEGFDDEIAKVQQERSDVIAKKQSAQNIFDTVTRNIITDEIETAAKDKLTELKNRLSEVTAARAQLESEEQRMALELSGQYEQYLGKNHMNLEDIDRLRGMLDTGAAVSVIDAVSKLEHPEKA